MTNINKMLHIFILRRTMHLYSAIQPSRICECKHEIVVVVVIFVKQTTECTEDEYFEFSIIFFLYKFPDGPISHFM